MVEKKGGKEIAHRPMSIVEARFDLSRRQNDIMDVVFAESDGIKREFAINVADMKKLYQMDDNTHAYSFLKKAVKTFEGKGFKLKENENTEVWYSWFTSIKYINGSTEENSRIILKISEELRDLIEYSKRGAYYRIEYSLNLESKYSKRIYYYLIDHKNQQVYPGAEKGVFKVEVKELLSLLQCPPKYKYGDLKRKVLSVAFEEINGSTDIEFDYEEIEGKTAKGQRAVVEIMFKVKDLHKRKSTINDEISSASEEVQKIFNLFGCSCSEAESLYNTAIKNNRSWDETMEVLEYTTNKKTENKVGYALTLLKNGFEKPKETKGKVKKNSFNNFDGRDYTEEQYSEIENRKRNLQNNNLENKKLENYEVEGQMEIEDYPEVLPKAKEKGGK